jgi:hypothetical protein
MRWIQWASWRSLLDMARNWGDRPELRKPEHEAELPDSDIPPSEERMAIQLESERRRANGT